MITSVSDSRDALGVAATSEIISLIFISYVFLAPLPFYEMIIFVGLITFIMSMFRRTMVVNQWMLNQAQQASWANHLTARIGINNAISMFDSGRVNQVDWRSSSKEAFDDIKMAKDDDKLTDKMSSGMTIFLVLYSLSLPFSIVGRALIGFSVAHLVKTYAPNFANAVVTGSWA